MQISTWVPCTSHQHNNIWQHYDDYVNIITAENDKQVRESCYRSLMASDQTRGTPLLCCPCGEYHEQLEAVYQVAEGLRPASHEYKLPSSAHYQGQARASWRRKAGARYSSSTAGKGREMLSMALRYLFRALCIHQLHFVKRSEV